MEIKVNLYELSKRIFDEREKITHNLPSKPESQEFILELLSLLFPRFGKIQANSPEEIEIELLKLKIKLAKILKPLYKENIEAIEIIINNFFSEILETREILLLDAEAIASGDPAAEGIDEVILTYPGFFAIAVYRFAHIFYKMNVPIFPRLLTEFSHQGTGIDIHPGAEIGKSFFIDHGTGIVIGETTIIGNNVKIYQGVTLGALSVKKAFANTKRHPTIEDNVIIYSGATILGGNTIIGHDSIIGGNAWITESIPPFSIVYNKSEVKVRTSKEFENDPINFVI